MEFPLKEPYNKIPFKGALAIIKCPLKEPKNGIPFKGALEWNSL